MTENEIIEKCAKIAEVEAESQALTHKHFIEGIDYARRLGKRIAEAIRNSKQSGPNFGSPVYTVPFDWNATNDVVQFQMGWGGAGGPMTRLVIDLGDEQPNIDNEQENTAENVAGQTENWNHTTYK